MQGLIVLAVVVSYETVREWGLRRQQRRSARNSPRARPGRDATDNNRQEGGGGPMTRAPATDVNQPALQPAAPAGRKLRCPCSC